VAAVMRIRETFLERHFERFLAWCQDLGQCAGQLGSLTWQCAAAQYLTTIMRIRCKRRPRFFRARISVISLFPDFSSEFD